MENVPSAVSRTEPMLRKPLLKLPVAFDNCNVKAFLGNHGPLTENETETGSPAQNTLAETEPIVIVCARVHRGIERHKAAQKSARIILIFFITESDKTVNYKDRTETTARRAGAPYMHNVARGCGKVSREVQIGCTDFPAPLFSQSDSLNRRIS